MDSEQRGSWGKQGRSVWQKDTSDVRKLLEAQEELMHLDTEQVESKSREELVHMVVKANEATYPHQTTAELIAVGSLCLTNWQS